MVFVLNLVCKMCWFKLKLLFLNVVCVIDGLKWFVVGGFEICVLIWIFLI